MNITKAQLLQQLDNIHHNGLLAMLKTAADANGLPLSYVVAVASRETNCTNILGDFQGGAFHGVGILQIDVQHPIAQEARDDGTWKTNPQPLIDFGVKLLASNLADVKAYFDDVTDTEAMMIGACGYNCGIDRAMSRANDDGDPNMLTTGHDYGNDVIARMDIFDSLLRGSP